MGVVSDANSEFRLALHTKQDKFFNYQFTNYLEKCDFFVNDSKHRHIIYCWIAFFTTIKNSRSLPQNKALFGLDQLVKFADDPGTFIGNRRYHLEEQVVVSTLEPRTASGLAREQMSNTVNRAHYTRLLCCSVTDAKLASHIPLPSELKGLAHVAINWLEVLDRGRP